MNLLTPIRGEVNYEKPKKRVYKFQDMKILFISFLMLIIGLYFYKYSPEILEIEKKEAINFLRKFLAKYTTVLILRIISILIMLTGFWGIASFIMKQL